MEDLALDVVTFAQWQRDRRAGKVRDGKLVAYIDGGPLAGRLVASADVGHEGGRQVIALDATNPGHFTPWPNVASRDAYYVSAPSGSGKSTFLARVLAVWRLGNEQEYPEAALPIYIVSPGARAASDPAYAGIEGITFLPADSGLAAMALEEFAPDGGPCFVAFDDIEAIADKDDAKATTTLMGDCLTNGRKLHVSTAVLSHLTARGHSSRLNFLECTWFVVFRASVGANCCDAMKRHFGLRAETIAVLRGKAFGRYLCIANNTTPAIAVGERQVALYDNDAIAAEAKKVAKVKTAVAAAQAKAGAAASALPL